MMMKDSCPLISVVVPVYNVAPYLRRCLDSLLAQTFRDFELVLVDDGSTDGSSAICDEYAEAEGRGVAVRVFHQSNTGVSAARNRGMAEARGCYISFVDADDWVEPGFLEAFAEEPGETYLVVQGYTDRDGTPRVPPAMSLPTFQSICDSFWALEKHYVMGEIWNKRFCKHIVTTHNLRFNEKMTVGEDMLFVLSYLYYCDNMTVLSTNFYRYSERPTSLTKKDYPFMPWRIQYDEYNQVLQRLQSKSPAFVERYRAQRYFVSLRTLCVGYRDQVGNAPLTGFIAVLKNEMRGNSQLSFKGHVLFDRVVGWGVLALPTKVVNGVLSTIFTFRRLLHI